MRITSWNVNSIRSRLDRVLDWLDRRRPDLLCLQETKVVDEDFPREAFAEHGYTAHVHGQKTYNGVALLARDDAGGVEGGAVERGLDDGEARLIAAPIGDVKVVNVYVPNGQAVDSPKFPFKLDWLARLETFLASWADPEEPLLVVGDFNIAPEDRDVHDPDAWRGKVLFHPKEHAALASLAAWGLHDLFRDHEERAGLYSWWDYRRLGFPKNRGLRIDLVLGTAAAAARCRGVVMEREERKGKGPSDHIPVTAFLDEDPAWEGGV